MTDLRVLIAEDESVARRRLRRLLEEAGGVEVVAEAEDGVELLERLKQHEVDLVLLDIRMPRLSGLEALALMEPGGPAVVFTTAYAEHAVEAFERDAVDYLLKPIAPERLAQALERVRRRLDEGLPEGEGSPPERLVVPTRRGLVLLRPGDLSHAVLEGASCLLFARGARYVTDFRLSDLERRLPPERYRRVHRQALVDLERIERLEPTPSGGYVAFLEGGFEVPVSRQEARRLRRVWELPR
ncbi:MAG: LytTR family DNA-binding domain-containing protein [Pseudomonadota bacterium]